MDNALEKITSSIKVMRTGDELEEIINIIKMLGKKSVIDYYC